MLLKRIGRSGSVGVARRATAHEAVRTRYEGRKREAEMTATGTVDRYARLTRMIATDQCVILDGANGTELIKVRGVRPEVEEHVWGLTALIDAPEDVARVHRSYIDVGCDVVCTNTWGLPTALRNGATMLSGSAEPVHWMDIARRAVRLARSAAAGGDRA